MTNQTIHDDWTGIPEEVEKIIASRTVKMRNVSSDGQSSIVTERTRPFRFVEFAREAGITNGRAHAYVRHGVIPHGPMRAAILAWVKKNRRRVKS